MRRLRTRLPENRRKGIKMYKILVANDDGYDAPGICNLVEALSEIAEVYVVAPKSQKSACGQAITISHPMMVTEVDVPFAKKAWAVEGFPADCVKLGVREFATDVDLVVAGINMGSNVGYDTMYSGTVGAAAEAAFCGMPSIAVSVCSQNPQHYEAAKAIAVRAADLILKYGMEKETMLNINIPDLPMEEIKGERITKLGYIRYRENFKHDETTMGEPFYWYKGDPIRVEQDPNSDIQAIRDGYISITPLHFDLADYKQMEFYKRIFGL